MTPAVERAEQFVRVLVVDDLDANVALIRRLLPETAYEVFGVRSAAEALEAVWTDLPDVMLLDVRMPGENGFEFCRHLKSDERTRLIPVILVTAASAVDDRLHAIEAGADEFISKPLNPVELRARVRALARMKRYTQELESAEQVIVSLALTIEARDAYTEGHCQRIADYAVMLGRALDLHAEDLRALRRGGYLHDVGKVGIPDAVLLKAGPLTPSEFAVMKTHTLIGERLCGELRSLAQVRPIVRSHHERRNGSGYPDGLAGDDLPLLAEIIGLVDVYDALTTTRPYRPAMSGAAAGAELRTEARRGLHRIELVEQFLALVTPLLVEAPPVSPPHRAGENWLG